jgi:hypothetical protein
MVKKIIVSVKLTAVFLVLMGALHAQAKNADKQSKQEWQENFDVNKANLASTGKNPYFVLEPGYSLHYKHEKENLTITVLNETKIIDGVETRVVEERETNEGQLAEISRNYYAIDRTNDSVYYFGEDVNDYNDGKVVGHGGSWLAGVNGNRFGLMMPGKPKAGYKYYQELAPKVAMDRSEIVSVDEKVATSFGSYEHCLHIKDGSAIEKGTDDKWYVPGIGLIKDAEYELVKSEPLK